MSDPRPPSNPGRPGFLRRPFRCEARLVCWLTPLNMTGIRGRTVNVSSTGLYVQLEPRPLPREVEVGGRIAFGLTLPDQEQRPVEGAAEVVWINLHDRDFANRPVIGLGLKVVGYIASGQERISNFVKQFRYAVLVADDDPDYAEVYAKLEDDYRIIQARDSKSITEVFQQQEVSVLLIGDQLSDMASMAFLQKLSERFPHALTSRVVVSEGTMAAQLQVLINVGKVFSYLRKPFALAYLKQVVQRAVDAYALAVENSLLTTELDRANQRLELENSYLRQRFVGFEGFEQLVGGSRELKRVLDELVRVRASDATVHIHGETGTGKELIARALHLGGPRANGPFVAQNCAGLSESLQQSTLFGHKKGAFTGADRDYEGVFQRANGGTLFLDEVAELTPSIQATLLRALQEGEILPVGAERTVKVDVRIISATHKDLREEVQQGRFREDLYFRLVVIPVRLPALRERSGDVPILAMHFLDLHCERKRKNIRGFTYEAMRALERYPWPGNVRELENEIERLVVLTEDNQKVPLELVSPHIRDAQTAATGPHKMVEPDGIRISARAPYDDAVSQLERTLIQRALEQTGGNVSQAAKVLGMERSRLAKLRDRLGLSGEAKPSNEGKA